MQIYNKEAIQAMWDIVKPLAKEIPIYKETFTEDASSTPKSYILLVSDITDNGKVYGDGTAKIRSHDCDIHLISKGVADSSKDLHNINKNKIAKLLQDNGIDYISVNLGYDDNQKRTEHTFSIEVLTNG